MTGGGRVGSQHAGAESLPRQPAHVAARAAGARRGERHREAGMKRRPAQPTVRLSFYFVLFCSFDRGEAALELLKPPGFSRGKPEPRGCGSAGSCCNPLLGWRGGTQGHSQRSWDRLISLLRPGRLIIKHPRRDSRQ